MIDGEYLQGQANQPDHPGTVASPQRVGQGTEPRKIKHGTLEPRAKASEAQEPELPQNAFEEEEEGSKPVGQGDDGKETHKPLAAFTALTTATERAANLSLPVPYLWA